jgi:hypothetical protein
MSLEGFVNVALRLLSPTNSSRFLSPFLLWIDGRFWPKKGSLGPKAMLFGHKEMGFPRPPLVHGSGRKGPIKACFGDLEFAIVPLDHDPAETSITSSSGIRTPLGTMLLGSIVEAVENP